MANTLTGSKTINDVLLQKHCIEEFQQRVIALYNLEGRVFYWRTHFLNCWEWLVLEILLKRTRAETVERVFPTLISKYSEPSIVLHTSDLELENDLRYLGLYRQRRKTFKLVAERILKEHGGQVPLDLIALSSIPYVGLYISNAVLCFCNNQRRPIVDSNIARVLTQFYGLVMPKDAREKWIWEIAEKMLPDKNWREYNFGLLDLGSMICKKKTTECSRCCLEDICTHVKKNFKK